MNTLTELDEFFKKLNRMRSTKDEYERERLKIELDDYLKQLV